MDKTTSERLKLLEKTSNEYWNISSEVGKFLYILIKSRRPKNILELGTSNGYSTIWLALAAKEYNSKIRTIEYFQERIDLAIGNFKHCNLDKYITVTQGKIIDVLENTSEMFDFVFIDANKPEYLQYFKYIENLLLPGGIVVSDNITSHRDKVSDYIDYTTNHKGFESVLIPMENGLMLHYKHNN